MCGRYTFTSTKHLQDYYHTTNDLKDFTPRYNAAPGSLMPVITNRPNPQIELMQWGLIPSWAKDPRIGYRLINARSETVASKPSFRGPFQKTRCLVPAAGFFEWQTTPDGKQPYYFTSASKPYLSFAGLYDTWKDPEGHPLTTYTIITTPADATVAPVHHRMPLILNSSEQINTWLSNNSSIKQLEDLLHPPSTPLESHPVTPRVNDPTQDDPQLLTSSA